ncbi:MAG: VPLPA-CTERM sorting domain-containing protein [Pseudomonadota bacterium]
MISKVLRYFAVAFLTGGLVAGAHAATITFTPAQGTQADGDSVDADRSILGNMTDGDTTTIYSLGIGGELTASIAPEIIKRASVLELTFGNNASFPESMQIYLGTDSTGTLLGEIFNEASGISSTSANGAVISAFANTPIKGVTSFLIGLGTNVGSALTFVDTTASNFAVSGDKDGFDIAELSITPVPIPAAGFLFLSGLFGAGLWRRRKIQKEVGLPAHT